VAPARDAIVAAITARCAPAGFDLVWPLAVGWYNEAVAAPHRLDDLGRPGALAVLVGNTRALWPRLRAAVAADPELRGDADPLDRYTERVVHEACAALPVRASARFAHHVGERVVAMQRLAEVAGFAALAPSNLCVHPEYGPWISLRAVVVADADGPTERPPPVPRTCDCDRLCLPALERALAATGAAPSQATVAAAWRQWLAVRDACPIGRAHRFGDAQLRYHYIKDPRALTDE
jgi:cyanocobalamin reductase (cyanide-eliminating) / alkylcobalamin dealkylase